jgi:cytochrome c-type protein NapC
MNSPEPARRGFAAGLWRRPQRWFLLGIPIGGLLAFIVGMGLTGGFFGALQYASTDAFCTSCHEMDTPFQELTHSLHHSNELGIRASCADCHVPPAFLPGLMRHMAASVELWGHLTGELDTRAKYENHRLALAQKVWKELKANDSAECRGCHTPAAMALARSPSTAAISPATMHQSLARSYTCIDCHKGTAHTLPKGN